MVKVGNIYQNTSGQLYQIVGHEKRIQSGRKPRDIYRIRFIETKYETEVQASIISRGIIKDRLSPSVSGIGCLGYATSSDNPKAHTMWRNMINRCYNSAHSNFQTYGGKGVSVDVRWCRFDYFLEDLSKIDGYDEKKFNDGILILDKDKKQMGVLDSEKVYSLNTCTLMTAKENAELRNYECMKNEFIAISPDGKEYKVSGVRQFAKEYSLNHAGILMCLNGKRKTHNGWKFYY